MFLDAYYCPQTFCSTQDLAQSWMRASRGDFKPLAKSKFSRILVHGGEKGSAVYGEMAVFYTFSQQKGRGQSGNVWFCGDGANIAMSLAFCPPDLDAEVLFCLDMALSLGVLRYVRRINPDSCLKWPNDVYIGLRKLAGILVETRIEGWRIAGICFGIGLNLNQLHFPDGLPNPVSFRQVDGVVRDLPQESLQLAMDVVESYTAFMDRYASLGQEAGALFNFYKAEYLAALLFYGQYRDYCFQNQRIQARMEDVDETGHLWLRNAHGKLFSAGIKELRYILP